MSVNQPQDEGRAADRSHLTPAQLEAIYETRCSLLVSAAAGSGKTTVLAERCVALVCDVEESQRCDIDRLLVVTFTDAAAEEMRTRIRAALRRRIDEHPDDERLQRQIYLLECSSISTIHSFCKTLIERYFPQAGVDPQASVLSEEEADLLRDEVLDELFLAMYASNGPEGLAFQALVDDYGAGDDYKIGRIVLQIHGFISTLPDPQRWLEDALNRARPDGPDSLLADLHKRQCERLRAELQTQMDYCAHLAQAIKEAWPVADMHAEAVSEHYFVLKRWLDKLDTARPECWEQVAEEIRHFEFGRAKSRPRNLSDEDKAAYDAAKAQRDRIKTHFERRLRERLCSFTAEEYREGLERVAPHVGTLVYLVREFDRMYTEAKAAQAVVDFNDLQRRALRLLCEDDDPERPSDVARQLQQRYRYVLVDEFQDVDPLQERILRLVSRESADPPVGNLFTVGDIKQSIYRFRLAEPSLFTARADRFSRDTVQGDGRDAQFPRMSGKTFDVSEGGQDAHPPQCGTGVPPVKAGKMPAPPVWHQRLAGEGGQDARPPERDARSPDGRVIPLQKNFRSRAEVLDAINLVFDALMSREFGGSDYDNLARLHPGAEYPEKAEGPTFGKPAVELFVLEPVTEQTRTAGAASSAQNDSDEGDSEEDGGGEAVSQDELEGIEREGYLIGRLVRHWMGAGKQGRRWYVAGKPEGPGGEPVARPIEYRDIVILLRSLTFKAEPIADVLRRMGLPVRIERQAAALDTTEFRDCISLLRVLDNEQQDIPLAAVMRSPLLGDPFTESDLLTIRMLDREGPFHAAVRRYSSEGADADLRHRVGALLEKLARYRTRIQRMPVADVLWELYEDSNYLAYVCGLPDGARRRDHLIRLHELARQFGRFARQGLRRFLHFIDDLTRRERHPRQAGIGGDENCIRIMTIHASKGLEFPVVVLADLHKRFNLEDARGAVLVDRKNGIAMRASDPERRILYPTLAHQLAIDETVRENLSEELRVLYVALTRAREHLVLIGRMNPQRVDLYQAIQRSPDARSNGTESRGNLPQLERESANCPLEWLLAALGTAPAGQVWWPGEPAPAGQPLFQVTTYARATTDAWQIPPAVEPQRAEALAGIARLEPLPGEEPIDGLQEARRLIAALCEEYPARSLTATPGRLPVGELKRRWDASIDLDFRLPAASRAADPPRPAFISQDGRRDPNLRGSATHRFLQLVDLARPCDTDDLQQQLTALCDGGRLSPEEAAAVLIDSAAWFFDTDLGRRIRANAGRVHRETAFEARIPPERYDPRLTGRDHRDVILVRGVVDLILDGPACLEIVDYKTDLIEPDGIQRRAAVYRPQLDIYATAMESAFRRAVKHRWLVFLYGRAIIDLEPVPVPARVRGE